MTATAPCNDPPDWLRQLLVNDETESAIKDYQRVMETIINGGANTGTIGIVTPTTTTGPFTTSGAATIGMPLINTFPTPGVFGSSTYEPHNVDHIKKALTEHRFALRMINGLMNSKTKHEDKVRAVMAVLAALYPDGIPED